MTGHTNGNVIVSLLADLVIDSLVVTRNDTATTLNPGDMVPEGTSLTVEEYAKNCGATDAEDFDVEYYDNGNFIDDDFEGSTVSADCNETESEFDTFTINGIGAHTLSVCLDTTNVIPESDENNNCQAFAVNVGNTPAWAASPVITPTFDVYITGDGESEIIQPEYSNEGTATWLTNDVALNYRHEEGDSGKLESAFYCADWVNNHRPTYVTSTTAPNQIGQFPFRFCNLQNNPPNAAPYIEHFDLGHGSEWFYPSGWDDRVTVRIHVLSPPAGEFCFSLSTGVDLPGLPDVDDEDVVCYDLSSDQFSMYFDGDQNNIGHIDIDAFSLLSDESIIFSISFDNTIPGVGDVEDGDLIRYHNGSYTLYLDSSSIAGLSGEDIDAVHYLSSTCILLSSSTSADYPGLPDVDDEDVVCYNPTNDQFTMHFDGSEVGLTTDTDAFSALSADVSYLSLSSTFCVPGSTAPICGDRNDLIRFDAISDSFSFHFDGSTHSLDSEDIDALHLSEELPVITPTPTNTYTPGPSLTPSNTPTATNTYTPGPSLTPSYTPIASNTPTVTFTITPDEPTLTPSHTPSITNSPTNTPSPSSTLIPTVTNTLGPSPTPSLTLTVTRTNTASPSPTPTKTPTVTRTDTPGPSPTPSLTLTVTSTHTASPSPTPTNTPTVTRTHTQGPCPAISPSPSLTAINTLVPPDGDAYENDDSSGQASTITTDGSVQVHTFHDEADSDWIAFHATEAITYVIEVRVPPTSTADVVLELYDACNSSHFSGSNPPVNPDIRMTFQLSATGTYYVRLFNNEPESYGPDVTYHLSVRALQDTIPSSALILVAGRRRDNDPLQDNIHRVTDSLYQFATTHGCTTDQMAYLATDTTLEGVTERLTFANLQEAITSWAVEKVEQNGTLTIYMIDHGDSDLLYLDETNSERITPLDLDEWLDQLEEAVPGVKVNLVVEACYSGSFIDLNKSVSAPGRVIITSTSPDALAYTSQDGATFSDTFIGGLVQGMSLYSAFEEGKWAAAQGHPDQQAWLDDNGDAAYTAADGLVAAQRALTCAPIELGQNFPPNVAQVEIRDLSGSDGEIWAEALDDDGVRFVWALVYPPSYQPQAGDEMVAEPQQVQLFPQQDGDGSYSVDYRFFDESGQYRIVIYAEDNEGLLSRPQEVTIQTGWQLYLPTITR